VGFQVRLSFGAIIFCAGKSCRIFISKGFAMKNRKPLPFLLFVVTTLFLLQACNLAVSNPGGVSPAVLSQTPPSNTPTPFPSLTSTVTSAPSATPQPTITLTLFYDPTVTPTRQWSACPGIVVTQTDTDKGEMLHILRCEDNLEYDLGPLAKGTYAVGPNDKFLVYITVDGMVYGSRIGDRTMVALYNLKREKIFTVFNKGVTPNFVISFADDAPLYKLVLVEKNYNQKRPYDLPLRLTN
jgi:hypothetical protein